MWKAVGNPDTNRNGQDIKTVTSMGKVEYDHTPA